MLIKGAVFIAVCCLGLHLQTARAVVSSDISVKSVKNATHFTTWQGIEPDKWATLWLIKRYISPQAYFLLVPPNTDLPDKALAFGVPDVPIRRANRESMFRRLKQAMNLDDTQLNYIDAIVHDIEVNIWDAPAHKHSLWFETLYRQMQARYQRDQVPVDCYLAFFDAVARLAVQSEVTSKDYSDQLALSTQCPGVPDKQEAYITSMSHLEILREISLGKRVVFVDTREDEEYEEVHLPGARLLRLRDINQKSVQVFADADLIVPYCVKDFRGFEVAKSIKQLGLNQVATLSPNGLKGWLSANLPVTKLGASNDGQATEALLRCATEPASCLKGAY